MSAPDTNIHKQEKQHRGPLAGIRLAVGFAAVLLLVYIGYLFTVGSGSPETEIEMELAPGAEITQPAVPAPSE